MRDEKFYVPSTAEKPAGAKLVEQPRASDAEGARHSFYVDPKTKKVYSGARYGYYLTDGPVPLGVMQQWSALTGIAPDDVERGQADDAFNWNNAQYDRDVAKLHIEAARLGFRCVPASATGEDKYRRVYDDDGKPTGMVKHQRFGTIVPESDVRLGQIIVPESISANSAFVTESTRVVPASEVTPEMIKRGSDPSPAKNPKPTKKRGLLGGLSNRGKKK
jgi:hypothetical protein